MRLKILSVIAAILMFSPFIRAQDSSHTAYRILGTTTTITSGVTACFFTVTAPNVIVYNNTIFLCESDSTYHSVGSAGSGTVTSVGLTLPTFFSVSGSPVTTSGTLAGSYATGLTSNELNILGVSSSGAAGLYTANTLTIPTYTGSITATHCAEWSSSAVLEDSGGSCGGGGVTLQTNSSNNSSQTTLNLINSSTNSVGLSLTFTNTTGGTVKAEVAGSSYTGNAATATALSSYTGYSVYGSGASTGSWITPSANGQCLMSAASNYATTTPSFQSCPSGFLNPMTTLGDMIYGGSSGTATRLAGPTAFNIQYLLTDTPSGGAAQTQAWNLPGVPVDTQSSATPAVGGDNATTAPKPDRASCVNTTNTSTSTAMSIAAAAGSTNFGSNFVTCIINSGSVINTLTPTGSTINGNTTLKLVGAVSGHNPEQAFLYSDGTNWFGGEILPTDANGRLAAEGFGVLTGDVTNTAGSYATTVGKINGTSLAGLASGLVYNTTSTGVPSIATAAQVNTTVSGLTGCSTATYVYTPAGADCVAPSGGSTSNAAWTPAWGYPNTAGISSNSIEVWSISNGPYTAQNINYIVYNVTTDDTGGTNYYDIGVYGPCLPGGTSCPLVVDLANGTHGINFGSTGTFNGAIHQSGPITLTAPTAGQYYYIAVTGNAATAVLNAVQESVEPVCDGSGGTSSSGQLPSTITIPPVGYIACGNIPMLTFHN